MELNQRIIDAYRDGSPLSYIQQCFGVSNKYIKEVLIDYKERNRKHKKAFTDEFKKLIAERDINGVPRRQIAFELDVSMSTVQSACKQFGQAVKERAFSENTYTVVEGVHNLEHCPNCGSKRVNEIESVVGNVNTTGVYCMGCGSEYFILNGQVYQVNWEYID